MMTLASLVSGMKAGQTTAVALVERARERAERHAGLNALAHADWSSALSQASRLDEEAAAGRIRGRLHGIPISVKDLFLVRGMPTRAGTRARLPDLDVEEAEAVVRLRAEGAIVFAKTNMHEIALGATGENVWTGDVKNPFDPARQAGGSSSGAGVSVATGIGLAALGSDTGGSVRIPAAFCGVVGYKPTFASISLRGALPLSWTCDHAGPLGRSIGDCRLLYEAMSQQSATPPVVPRKPRLAVPAAWLRGRLHPAVRDRFERALAGLRAEGTDVVEVPTPKMPLAWIHYTPIVRAEAAWVHREALAAGGEGFSDLVLPPLLAGRALPAQDYLTAMHARAELREELGRILKDHDALILPTTAIPAPVRGELQAAVEGGALSVREAVLGQTLAFSWCGLPALSLPFAEVEGLPLGWQVVAADRADAALLALGEWFESRFDWRGLDRFET